MHIMIAAPEYGLLWGGIGTYLEQFVRGARGRHEFTILAGAAGAPHPEGARLLSLARSDGGMMLNYQRFQLELRRHLPALVREHRPDLLVVHHAQMPDLLALRPSCPVVVTTHTTILGQAQGAWAAIRQGSPLDATERTTLTLLPALLPTELYYWKRVAHAIFVSKAVRGQVERAYAPRLRTSAIIPNGLALDTDTSGSGVTHPKIEGRYVLFGGRLLGIKGIAVLLRAFARVPDDGTRLVLAGRGDLPRWRHFARACGLSDARVEFLGGIPHADYLNLLRAATAFVLPSYSESCPYALIEALALGKAVLATSVGGIPEMVDTETAVLVRPRDPVRLANGLTRVLADEALRTNLGRNATTRWRERFNATRMCAETIHYFEDLLAVD